MKTRKGFVSNSSSSSFILAVRNYHSVDELDAGDIVGVKEEIVSWLKDKPLVSYAQMVHDWLIEDLGETYARDMITDSYCAEQVQNIHRRARGRVEDLLEPGEPLTGWSFYRGWAAYDQRDCWVEAAIGEGSLGISGENVRLG